MSFPCYERYRESGVEWLREVPEGWEVTRVKTLFEIRKRISGEEGYEVLSITQQGIRVKDVESGDGQLSMDYSKYQFVEIGDFAMNHMDLLTGYVDTSPYFGVTSPDYRVFRTRDRQSCFDRYYLYLFQNAYKNKIFFPYGQGSSQLGRWRLPTDEFNSFRLPVPPFPEQRAIASFLDGETAKIDALVAEQERLIELLKEKRQAVISHAVTKGLNPDAPMKDSEVEWLGEVPEEWPVAALNYRYEIALGKMLDEKRITGNHLAPYLRNIDVQWDEINTDDLPEMDFSGTDLERFSLKRGDLLVCEGGEIGRAAIWNGALKECFYQKALHRLRPRKPTSDHSRYMYYLLLHSATQGRFLSNQEKATIVHLTAEALRRYRFCFPGPDEQAAIASFLDEEVGKVDGLMQEAHKAISLLKERRTALISAAVTGKIDVRGVTS